MVRFLLLLVILSIASPAHAAEGKKVLHMYNWSTYASPELLEKFEKDTGIDVTVDTYDTNEDMIAKLQAGGGGYDIVFPSLSATELLKKEGLLLPVRGQDLPNFKHLDTPFIGHSFDPKDEYSLPYFWGTTGYALDTAVYDGPLTDSWALLFDPPPILQEKVGMLDDFQSLFDSALIYLGYPPCSEDPEALQKLQDLFLKQKPYVKTYSAVGYQERLETGDVAIQMAWSGDVFKARKQKSSLRYVLPKEGFIYWIDRMAIPKGAQNIENAKIYMNWVMEPENAALASQLSGFATPNKNAVPLLSVEIRDASEFQLPKNIKATLLPMCSSSVMKNYDRILTRLKQ